MYIKVYEVCTVWENDIVLFVQPLCSLLKICPHFLCGHQCRKWESEEHCTTLLCGYWKIPIKTIGTTAVKSDPILPQAIQNLNILINVNNFDLSSCRDFTSTHTAELTVVRVSHLSQYVLKDNTRYQQSLFYTLSLFTQVIFMAYSDICDEECTAEGLITRLWYHLLLLLYNIFV